MNSLFKTGFWTGSAWKRAAEDANVRAIEGAVRALRTALSNEEEAMDIVDAKVAVDLATAQSYSENVFLFVPNLIGASSFNSA